jgi:hypothetical protein
METVNTMNHYGAQALEHWTKYRPRELALIEDQTKYFTDLGEEIQGEISRRRDAAEHQSQAGQTLDFLANLQSLNAAGSVADEVMREMVFDIEETEPN